MVIMGMDCAHGGAALCSYSILYIVFNVGKGH